VFLPFFVKEKDDKKTAGFDKPAVFDERKSYLE